MQHELLRLILLLKAKIENIGCRLFDGAIRVSQKVKERFLTCQDEWIFYMLTITERYQGFTPS